MHRVVVGVLLLAGCDQVFQLTEPDPIERCVGRNGAASAGFYDRCLTPPELEEYVAGPGIDTGKDGAMGDCTEVVAQSDPQGTEVCVILARSISIPTGTTAFGDRPLLLLATDDLVLGGSLSVASQAGVNGAGAPHRTCPLSLRGAQTTLANGGGGGAGGSFQTIGGDGGPGQGSIAGGEAISDAAPLGLIRAGCPGGVGGANMTTSLASGGARGQAGGGVYLVAGESITIDGAIDASGEPGGGGRKGLGTSGGGGGGGGGSGGLIGIDAPMILITARAKLIANGGGGGEGGPSSATNGADGQQVDPNGNLPFPSPGGAGSDGGDGGDGGHVETTAQPGVLAPFGGGGGGGGGGSTGHIVLFSTSTEIEAGAQLSPANNP